MEAKRVIDQYRQEKEKQFEDYVKSVRDASRPSVSPFVEAGREGREGGSRIWPGLKSLSHTQL